MQFFKTCFQIFFLRIYFPFGISIYFLFHLSFSIWILKPFLFLSFSFIPYWFLNDWYPIFFFAHANVYFLFFIFLRPNFFILILFFTINSQFDQPFLFQHQGLSILSSDIHFSSPFSISNSENQSRNLRNEIWGYKLKKKKKNYFREVLKNFRPDSEILRKIKFDFWSLQIIFSLPSCSFFELSTFLKCFPHARMIF